MTKAMPARNMDKAKAAKLTLKTEFPKKEKLYRERQGI
jgi:hypothetical protein